MRGRIRAVTAAALAVTVAAGLGVGAPLAQPTQPVSPVPKTAVPPPADETGPATAYRTLFEDYFYDIFVSSPAFLDGATLPAQYGGAAGVSPPLAWDFGPEGTVSYVVIVEDPDVPLAQPFAHWVVYNIPANIHALPEAVAAGAEIAGMFGAEQGANGTGTAAYFGPQPPSGATHTYDFQVFALDTTLAIAPADATVSALTAAMTDHVIAMGEMTATYRGP